MKDLPVVVDDTVGREKYKRQTVLSMPSDHHNRTIRRPHRATSPTDGLDVQTPRNNFDTVLLSRVFLLVSGTVMRLVEIHQMVRNFERTLLALIMRQID